MYLNLFTQSPVDVLNRLRDFDIEVTDSDFTDIKKAKLLVAKGKTEKAKAILREMGVNVLSDDINIKLNKDNRVLSKMSMLGELLMKAGYKDPSVIPDIDKEYGKKL